MTICIMSIIERGLSKFLELIVSNRFDLRQ